MPQTLIPVARWKIHAESTNEQAAIRLTGRALSDATNMGQCIQTVLLTHDQAQELVSGLNLVLLELELQRIADLARGAEGAGYPP
ncbi:hypothetical protein PQR02_11725 [Paraburkholderia sediminicola]|uniref:Uncharacterized protein n=1 Tax=Paraburkholderia rhynchosiae TaxID=487049 RepID=A0ACC7NPB0_9BURK